MADNLQNAGPQDRELAGAVNAFWPPLSAVRECRCK